MTNKPVPKICRIHDKPGTPGARWHVRRSIIARDIVPEYTTPCGGMNPDEMTDNVAEALAIAIKYTKANIVEAEGHLRALKAAKDSLDNGH